MSRSKKANYVRRLSPFSGGVGLRTQIMRSGMSSILIKGGHTVIAFLLAVTLARWLGPDGYGVYAFALAVIMVIAIPAQAGFAQLMIRETARAKENTAWDMMRGQWIWSNASSLMLSLVLGFSVLCVLWFGAGLIGASRSATLLAGVFLIPLVAVSNVQSGMVMGLGRVVLGQIPEMMLRPGLLLLFVVLTVIVIDGAILTPERVMGYHLASATIAAIAAVYMLRVLRPHGLLCKPLPRFDRGYWRKAVIPLTMVSGLQIINTQADIILLGMFRADDEVGIYRVVVQIATVVIFGLQAINQVLQPYFAKLYAQNDMQKLKKLFVISARASFVIALVPFLVFVFFGESLLSIVFGDEYTIGYIALVLLACGQIINAGMGSVGFLLNMTGHERDTMIGVAISTITNIVLNLVLIPPFGIEGAAISTSITLIVWNSMLRRSVKTRLGI